MIKITRGLDIPINGSPSQQIQPGPQVKSVAVTGPDSVGMKPGLLVKVGDDVAKGQVLFTDKKCPEINYTAPAAGKVTHIHRGEKRVFQSLVIERSGDAAVTFKSYLKKDPTSYGKDEIKALLLESGEWTALRTRPFSKVPHPEADPSALFVTAHDTNPLCPEPAIIIQDQAEAFKAGLSVLGQLVACKIYLCKSPSAQLDVSAGSKLQIEEFAGPHPAGNVGTHIHFLHPVHANRSVWYIGYQDVIAIGKLFTTGTLYNERVISLAGPEVKNPRLIRTYLGASLNDIAKDECKSNQVQIISGSVLSGRAATPSFGHLGRFHNQVSVIKNDNERKFLGWLTPGHNIFSIKRNFLSSWLPGKTFDFTNTTHGSLRSLVPIEAYEKVMPLDILPTYLLRSLLSHDTDRAQELGVLELDEEDLSLCTFVCPCKIDYGPVLRANLTTIEKDG